MHPLIWESVQENPDGTPRAGHWQHTMLISLLRGSGPDAKGVSRDSVTSLPARRQFSAKGGIIALEHVILGGPGKVMSKLFCHALTFFFLC